MSQRLTPDVDLEGVSPDEAFAALGNEIRLDIVRTLWRADAAREYVDGSDSARTMSFTALRRRVGVEDNGKFNYHLSQLVPHFVRDEEDGYRLSGAGKRIARTVVAVSGAGDFTADVERDCPLCGAAMTATYEDQWLRVQCTACDGLFGDEAPEGTVYLANYPAAGLEDRSAEEALSAGLYRCMLDLGYTMHGVCPECAGRIDTTVSPCPDHDPGGADGRCEACGTAFPASAEQRCRSCGFAKRLPVELFAMGLTPVIGFLDDQGIDALAPSFDDVVDLLGDRFETTVTEDPFRARLTVDGDPEPLRVTLDGDLDVVDIERPGSD